MTPENTTRKALEHKATDSAELREVKRLWWSLYNTLRVYPFMEVTLVPAMTDVEDLARNMQGDAQ